MRGLRRTWGMLLILLNALVGCRSESTPPSLPNVTASTSSVSAATIAAPITITRPGSTPPATVGPPASRVATASLNGTGTRAATSPVASPVFTGYQTPFPPPASCPVAVWSPHERRQTFPAFWLDGEGLAAGNPVGAIFYEGGQKVQWQARPGGSRMLAVTGERLDGTAPSARVENALMIDAGIWSSNTIFPAPGCWHLRGTDGVHTLDVIVYVYPATCRPLPIGGRPSTPSPCASPGA